MSLDARLTVSPARTGSGVRSYTRPEGWQCFCEHTHQGTNIAVIGPEINIRISAKDPMNYIAKYKITGEKLSQQFIDPTSISISHDRYEHWLRDRANRLAEVGNEFLASLRP